MAWYNDYRPTNFSEVIGQNLVKTVLQNALNLNKIKHGYLLSGPKGVGKTTIARIFANDLNVLDSNPQASMDIIELDAASNSGVENIRQLIDSAQTPPFAGKYKIFIIDEVHMLSKSAMNALLKILEEPPTYLIFLLATTNPEKLLPTVLSRLTKLALTSHSIEDIVTQLEMVATTEKMIVDKESLILIAKRSSGGQRDAINLLETLSSYGLPKYSVAETANFLGLVSSEIFDRVSDIFLTQNFAAIKTIIQEIENIGLDGEGFLAQFLDYLLESVFERPTASQGLILPVASILDLKLPINTIHSSFALIQAEITKHNLPKIVTNTILPEKKTEKLIKVEESELQTSRHSGLDPESPTIEDANEPSQKVFAYVPSENGGIPSQAEDDGVLDGADDGAFIYEDDGVLIDSEKNTPLKGSNEVRGSSLVAKSRGIPSQAEDDGILKGVNDGVFADVNSSIIEPVSHNSTFLESSEQSSNPLSKGSKSQALGDSETKTSLTKTNFKKYLVEILSLKTCPPPLKIVSNDINIELVQNENLKLSISSPIFLPQVKNEKTLKFIKEYLFQKTQNNYSIEVVLRDPSLKNTLKPVQNEQNNPIQENVGQNQKSMVELNLNKPNQEFKVPESNIFYKIYGESMPENNISDTSNLIFFTNIIPLPSTKILSEQSEDWNAEIGNIFDF